MQIDHPDVRIEMYKAGRAFVEENYDANKLNQKDLPIDEADIRVFICRGGVDPIWSYKGSTSMSLGLSDKETRDELFRTALTSYLNGTTFDITRLKESINKLASSIGPCLAFDFLINEEGATVKVYDPIAIDNTKKIYGRTK